MFTKVSTALLVTCLTVVSAHAVDDLKDTQDSETDSSPVNMVEAFQRLRAGNARFVEGKPRHPHEAAAWRTMLEKGQQPFAVVLGCSDSRVPPELVFDQGFGTCS